MLIQWGNKQDETASKYCERETPHVMEGSACDVTRL
jgi:hypothetical protein